MAHVCCHSLQLSNYSPPEHKDFTAELISGRVNSIMGYFQGSAKNTHKKRKCSNGVSVLISTFK